MQRITITRKPETSQTDEGLGEVRPMAPTTTESEVEEGIRSLMALLVGTESARQEYNELDAFTREEIVDQLVYRFPVLRIASDQLLFASSVCQLATLCSRVLGPEGIKQFVAQGLVWIPRKAMQ